MRNSKKALFIHWMESEIETCNQYLKNGKRLNWYLGELKPLSYFSTTKAECIIELQKIEADKTYKPWKDYYFGF